MGTTMHIIGIRPPTDDYSKKIAAYKACEAAGIPAPAELLEYFDFVAPSFVEPAGMIVELERSDAVTTYETDDRSGFEVDIAKLPPGVTRVRFFNS